MIKVFEHCIELLCSHEFVQDIEIFRGSCLLWFRSEYANLDPVIPNQQRDNWLEKMIINLYANGVSTREIT